MQKLLRFVTVAVIFVSFLIVFYSLVPAIVWMFGGSFQVVAQSPVYVIVFLFIGLPFQSFLFSECFDEDFYDKSKKH